MSKALSLDLQSRVLFRREGVDEGTDAVPEGGDAAFGGLAE